LRFIAHKLQMDTNSYICYSANIWMSLVAQKDYLAPLEKLAHYNIAQSACVVGTVRASRWHSIRT
jgi:hypothetical protein